MRPPQTRSSLTLPRGREAPDAPRSARNSPTRVHPARTALRMAAPRLSSPRHKICAGRRSLAARPRPTALPCNALHGAPASTALAASPRTRQFCATRKTPFCADQGSSLTSCRDFRPTGKEKCRDSLSLTKRWPEAESDEPCGKCPPPRATAVRRRRFRRASGHSFIGTRPRNARSVRREFHKPFRAPSRGSRARTARQKRSSPSLKRSGSRAAHRQKNIPSFKLENPSAAEAGDGNESTKEIPYLPSFLRRVRTVSDSSAPLPTQA